MKVATETISTFLWFFAQPITVGGVGIHWFLMPFILLTSIMIWNFPGKNVKKRGLLSLLVLPFIWVFIGLWGSHFWLDWQSGEVNPEWVQIPIKVVLPLSATLSVFFVAYLIRARIFAAAFAITNLYFVFLL